MGKEVRLLLLVAVLFSSGSFLYLKQLLSNNILSQARPRYYSYDNTTWMKREGSSLIEGSITI